MPEKVPGGRAKSYTAVTMSKSKGNLVRRGSGRAVARYEGLGRLFNRQADTASLFCGTKQWNPTGEQSPPKRGKGEGMEISCFSLSLDDEFKNRSRKMRAQITSRPLTDFEGVDRTQMVELLISEFLFPEMPEFATGDMERVEPEFLHGTSDANVSVYFPYKGDPQLFEYYHSSRPGSPPPPTFRVVDGMLQRTYRIDTRQMDRIEEKVDYDVATVKKYGDEVRRMIPHFNAQLRSLAEEGFDQRIAELLQNRRATATLAQSKLKIRKRSDGTERIVVPVHRQPLRIIPPKRPTPYGNTCWKWQSMKTFWRRFLPW